jgi:hypothetical protein
MQFTQKAIKHSSHTGSSSMGKLSIIPRSAHRSRSGHLARMTQSSDIE